MAKQEFPPLLAPGFHAMTLAELRILCVDRIAGSKRRKPVMDGLEEVIKKIIADKLEGEIWVDGSFLTKKTDPEDSDILVVMKRELLTRATPEQKATIDWLNSNLKPKHLCHSTVFFDCPDGHPERSGQSDYGDFPNRKAYKIAVTVKRKVYYATEEEEISYFLLEIRDVPQS